MKKNVTQPVQELEKPTLSQTLEENSLFQWISQNGWLLLYLFFGFIALCFFIYRLAVVKDNKTETDYFDAEMAFVIFQKKESEVNQTEQKEAYNKLIKLMKSHPELYAKYDGALAQILINRNEPGEAKPFANNAIKRTMEEESPFYTEFAKNTLLIADHQYSEALKNSLLLQEKMANFKKQDAVFSPFGEILLTYNLIRIGFMQKEMGLKIEELNTWKELKKLAANNNEAFNKINQQFEEGSFSLLNYIEAREQNLNIKNQT